jgi:hypothetical protein
MVFNPSLAAAAAVQRATARSAVQRQGSAQRVASGGPPQQRYLPSQLQRQSQQPRAPPGPPTVPRYDAEYRY